MIRAGLFLSLLFLLMFSSSAEDASLDDLIAKIAKTTPGDMEFSVIAKKVKGIGEKAVPGLLKAATENEGVIRAGCARCLGEIGGKDAVDGLLELLKAKKDIDDILIGIGDSGDKRAIKSLRELLKPDWSLPQDDLPRLIITLGEVGDEDAIPDLIELLRPAALEGHRYGANQALTKLSGQDFRENYKAARKWYEERKGLKPSATVFEAKVLKADGKQSDVLKGHENILGAEVRVDEDYLFLIFKLREAPQLKDSVYHVTMKFADGAKTRSFETASQSMFGRENTAASAMFRSIRVDESNDDGSGQLIRLITNGYKVDADKKTFTFILPRGSGIEKVDEKSNFTFEVKTSDKVADTLEVKKQ
jgi:hypothetical protein